MSDALAAVEMPLRVCSRCSAEYYFGSAQLCAGCREQAAEKAKTDARTRSKSPRTRGPGIKGSVTPAGKHVARESLVDLDHAIAEITVAREEMGAVPHGLTKYERAKATQEPLARLALVRRYCEAVLHRYGWRP